MGLPKRRDESFEPYTIKPARSLQSPMTSTTMSRCHQHLKVLPALPNLKVLSLHRASSSPSAPPTLHHCLSSAPPAKTCVRALYLQFQTENRFPIFFLVKQKNQQRLSAPWVGARKVEGLRQQHIIQGRGRARLILQWMDLGLMERPKDKKC